MLTWRERRKKKTGFILWQNSIQTFKKLKWIILQYFVRLCILKMQLIRYACKFNTGCQPSWIFFVFVLQLCGVKIGLLWEAADSSAVLLQCWLQRVEWLPEQEGGRWLWTRVHDTSSWGSCCTACPGFHCPGSGNLWGETRSLLHLLTHPLPLLRVKWEREKQRRMCSRCPESVYFPILPLFACNQILGGKRWDEERGKSCLEIISTW